MADQEIWAKRVAQWKSSGLTSRVYCKGKPFTAGGLRYWACRLRGEGQPGRAPVRVARVVRVSQLRSASPDQPVASGVMPALVVELGAARIAVRPGFDRATL